MNKSNIQQIDPQVQDDETFKVTFECSLFGPAEIVIINDQLYTIDSFIEQFPSFAEDIRIKLSKFKLPLIKPKSN